MILPGCHQKQSRWGHDVGVYSSKWGQGDKDWHYVEQDKGDLGSIGHCHCTGGHHLSGGEDNDVGLRRTLG